jgi:hypothetical protein
MFTGHTLALVVVGTSVLMVTCQTCYITKSCILFGQTTTTTTTVLQDKAVTMTKRLYLLICVGFPAILNANRLENRSLRSASNSHPTRQLSNQDDIIDYTAKTVVTDIAAIDLDQQSLEDQLLNPTNASFLTAYNVYTLGAFSGSYATLKLDKNLTILVAEGVEVFGNASDGRFVRGKTLEVSPSGSNTLKVQYHVYPVQETWTECHVGGNPSPVLERCYGPSGTIEVDDIGTFAYTYNPTADNQNFRTLQTLSTAPRLDPANAKLSSSETFLKFYEYYGQIDYANQLILAAFHKTATHDFAKGNVDFSSYDMEGRAVAVRRATVYLTLWMAVVMELDYAVHLCEQADPGSPRDHDADLHAWDSAVAFYTGSVAKQADGKFFEGNTLYTLAEERCLFSATCTAKVEIVNGESQQTTHANVNLKIFQAFNEGQQSLLDGNCASARESANRIVQQMTIPLIQGVIHHAYTMDLGYQFDDPSHDLEAQGAAFAASMLPLVHHCNPLHGDVIYENLRVGNGVGRTNYDQIMGIIVENLDCLGLSCEEIGGVADIVNAEKVYMRAGEPCHYTSAPPATSEESTQASTGNSAATDDGNGPILVDSDQHGPNIVLALGITAALVAGAFLVTILINHKRNGKEFDGPDLGQPEDT